ncbi:MAG: PH domain-containing protein [Balneolaceae bacterium]|nr:PH domain-containing protein [Balneolaceae bacterium]
MPRKKIKLHPEKSTYFWQYLFAILLIPLAGLGFFLLYRIKVKREQTVYTIYDDSINVQSKEYSENIDLVNISNITINQSRLDHKFNIGTLRIHTASKIVKLEGLKNPNSITNLILKAAEAERARLAKSKEIKKKEPEAPPGTLDKIDYLTGLWQQGILSDEDFQKEKKYFES